ncbi:transmembrane protein, putative (macronuclear) [Tetrahymena thermophila SB210]|uniref:Transmembrane protein, putative n=1 Tax=Tetrahymena thermophila (strain SB210) TaxID=312017 RepID=I7MB68_TETTS|nr:transmembrane protein, putative [Tetrahymena thermophila SB210]EAS07755.1 transmembrane protein, putative [Tetrahymena thermophila SB210]|eukprot:XP_001027997.1 transmembrane protein, putative [Tetrahymena thermophila SB210]
MSISKNTFALFLISASLLLSAQASLQIPVGFDVLKNQIWLNATYGTENCKIEAKAEFINCNNDVDFVMTGERSLYTCGAVNTGTKISGLSNYEANFKMGNFEADLVFAQYNDVNYPDVIYFTKSLCFGKVTNDKQQLSLLKQLNKEGLISQPRVYITFFNKYLSYFTKDDIIGQINLGEPNPVFIKPGSKFVKMFVNNTDTYQLECQFYSNGESTFFGQKIPTFKRYTIYFDTEMTSIDKDTLEYMLNILKERGYKITINQFDIHDQYYINTIEGLEPITISLLTEDKSPFTLTLDASVYTRKIAKGVYKLLLEPEVGSFVLGNTILTKYYFGYDAVTQNTFFAERAVDLNPQQVAEKAENFSNYLRSVKL